MYACYGSNNNVLDHFTQVGKMFEIESSTSRIIDDYKLSRYACFLIVQNDDSKKEVIALGQTYFAIQTDDKLKREKIDNEYAANNTHYIVGKEVRNIIERLGGIMPEGLTTPKSNIRKLEK